MPAQPTTTVAARARREPIEGVEARLLEAALAAFAEKGFHGTTMRDIAERAEASVSHAYYYFPGKRAILFRLVHDITAELADRLEAAGRKPAEDPAAWLARLVRVHVRLHAERPQASFVGNSELRSLAASELAEVMRGRDRVSAAFKAAIAAGVAEGRFDCPAPEQATLAIVGMATAVATWFRADGPLSPDAVADRYAALALRMVGAAPDQSSQQERTGQP